MIFSSIMTAISILIVGGSITYICFDSDYIGRGVAALTVTILLLIGSIVGSIWYYSSTESGKRTMKDWKSNVSGGITREVTVYDVNSNVIAKYEGKFDVEYDTERIKFDDEEGKRHIIYYTTGTIIIDEK